MKAAGRAVFRYEYSAALGVLVRSVIAYRAEQGDEWRGPWRQTMADAKRDAREHNREAAPA